MSKRANRSRHRTLHLERRHDQLAPLPVFVKRLLASLGLALGLIAVALSIGIAGYHYLGGFTLVDSLLEASMILGGMGPVNELHNDGIKIFASGYALFSGLIFIAVLSIMLAPVVHRILHKFHVDEAGAD
jgi:TRAP-type C4-dicarboxylate transport system permease small subunit